MSLDYQTIDLLRREHPAWRLLQADNAPLIVGFLHRVFIAPNQRSVAQGELAARLEDYLFHLREWLGETAFPRAATAYLDDWAQDARGWLRKYYPPGSDEAHFDLTPAVVRAIEWIEGLQAREFVGTESRLLTIFDLLEQLVTGTETDPEARLRELERRRAELDDEIDRVRAGDIPLMDPARVRERFVQVERTARGLLGDFRQVEQNFRSLDRQVRERIATWDGSKGELLESVFGERDEIADSDEGRSFRAFWDFLMAPARQEALSEMLSKALQLEAVADLEPDPKLARVHYDWLQAGEMTQRTVARLSEQLRRYLDDQAWLENRRIMNLIRTTEQRALQLREAPPPGAFLSMDEPAPQVELVMDRPLFQPPHNPVIRVEAVSEADTRDIDTAALFEQTWVDRARLRGRIRRALQSRDQVSLGQLLAEQPLEQGLAELVAWLGLAAEDDRALIDERRQMDVRWTDAEGVCRRASLPVIVFGRRP
ncbi:MAG: DUF3375 domain-containing protein [Halothiobacillaceae bacterium]